MEGPKGLAYVNWLSPLPLTYDLLPDVLPSRAEQWAGEILRVVGSELRENRTARRYALLPVIALRWAQLRCRRSL
ncbi:MAG: hypothetical protein K0U93_23765 [Gammaproteobacteria bacterium]|nr:hypothetical protein [Gammaproteobacteria bacterium]